ELAKAIMFQGTSSHVGKSILTTALCRIFYQDGYRVAPFKAQNMTRNSYLTENGLEVGKSQAIQAMAAGVAPRVEMNPVLIKPVNNSSAQVIVNGRPIGDMSDRDYYEGKNLILFEEIKKALATLQRDFEVIVIEGAGSPTEINLKDRDLANMRTARMAEAPVLLVADIHRGGALASVVGTLELLEPDERALVKGIVLNRFSGKLSLLKPALDFLEQKTGKPVVGVIPLMEINIPEEDSLGSDDHKRSIEALDWEQEFDQLAATCRRYLDMDKIYQLLG
ncbi:MAG: cobyric acid synthase, partial [Thermacetogeniaceae bacterium]